MKCRRIDARYLLNRVDGTQPRHALLCKPTYQYYIFHSISTFYAVSSKQLFTGRLTTSGTVSAPTPTTCTGMVYIPPETIHLLSIPELWSRLGHVTVPDHLLQEEMTGCRHLGIQPSTLETFVICHLVICHFAIIRPEIYCLNPYHPEILHLGMPLRESNRNMCPGKSRRT